MKPFIIFALLTFVFTACENDKPTASTCQQTNFADKLLQRKFKMGFSTWSYRPNESEAEQTYNFITEHTDIYMEQIDGKIPWKAWIENTPLPESFSNLMDYKLAQKIVGRPLLLSVSLLNTARNELAEDFDGAIPVYETLNDAAIREAYLKHIRYLVDQFSPSYLVFAMEVNELRINDSEKWSSYKLMADYIRTNLKELYPTLAIAESFTLHNWFNPDVPDKTTYLDEMKTYVAHSDFTAISFYPFMKGLATKGEFQQAFDFLHTQTRKPIAFVETCHLGENLTIESFNLSIKSDECQQNLYLETLLENAQQNNYEFVIWWAHRDYDALWKTFPEEVKDIGQLWRDTGLLDENGNERIAWDTWKSVIHQ